MNTLNAIALLVPTIAVFIGILMNRQETYAIRAELRSVEASLRGEIKSVEQTLRSEIKAEVGGLRSEMVQLRNSIHAYMVGLHERIAVVEAKQQG